MEPRIIDTFLETHNFAGKTAVPFATSGGSGLGEVPKHMQKPLPDAKVLRGGLLNGRPSQTDFAKWAEATLR